jgi:hypothetical protein
MRHTRVWPRRSWRSFPKLALTRARVGIYGKPRQLRLARPRSALPAAGCRANCGWTFVGARRPCDELVGYRRPAGQGDGVVVLGVVVVTVVGGADDGGGACDAACGAGAGAGTGSGADGGGSLCTAGVLAAAVGGVVMTGAEGGAVVGTGFASDCPDLSVSFITAVTDPNPTRNAATHASESKTRVLEKNERPPSASVAGPTGSRGPSPCRSGASSRGAVGSVRAPSVSCGPIGSVTLVPSATRVPLTCEIATINLSATDSFAKRTAARVRPDMTHRGGGHPRAGFKVHSTHPESVPPEQKTLVSTPRCRPRPVRSGLHASQS